MVCHLRLPRLDLLAHHMASEPIRMVLVHQTVSGHCQSRLESVLTVRPPVWAQRKVLER